MTVSRSQAILIVGGGQGIGLETTKAIFAYSPTAKIVVFGLHIDSAIGEQKGRIWVVKGDVRNPEDRGRALDTCTREMDGVDTLVYTAGVITPIERIEKLDMEDVKNAFDINVFGCMAMVSILPHMNFKT